MSGRGIPLKGGGDGGGLPIMGAFIQSVGRATANYDQAIAESKNASWFREQADYAEKAGQRKLDVFDRESQILTGDQMSSFAKAGIDTQAGSFFMAQTILARQQEHGAIRMETDMNVRAATLRAQQADSTARSLNSAGDMALWSAPFAMAGSLV